MDGGDHPSDHTKVMLAKSVTQGRLGSVDVHRATPQQFPHASGPDRGLGQQPPITLLLVGPSYLFGNPIDVPEADLDHLGGDRGDQLGIGGVVSQLFDAARQESTVTKAVRPTQGDSRHAPLCQPSRVFHGRSRGTAVVRLEPVLEHVQQGRHVLLDARSEQLLYDLITAQLGNVSGQQLPDLLAELQRTSRESGCHLGQLCGDDVAPRLHPAIMARAWSRVHTPASLAARCWRNSAWCFVRDAQPLRRSSSRNTMPPHTEIAAMDAYPTDPRRTTVKPLSEQLNDLAERAKQAEETVAAARANNRAALESQRERLKSSIDASRATVQGGVAAAQEEVQSWWDETRSNMHERFEALRAKRDEQRAEWDLHRAENRADDAELDAADAIDFAIFALDEAEYAVIDAVIDRADADELALQQS
jgi:hypothetical protein